MRIRHLFLVVVMAGLMFGGTFTCNSDDDDDDDGFTITSGGSGSVDTTTPSGQPVQSGATVTKP